jgi:2-keto-3-deoxy-L-rhamnonate aldolase RhmA
VTLRERLEAGETLLGAFLALGNPVAAEALALAGFDWLLVDLEHGAGGEAALLSQLQAAAAAGAPALVRVEDDAPARAARALDLGAAGVMCPRVDSAAQAATWARAVCHRGAATATRAARYGLAARPARIGSRVHERGAPAGRPLVVVQIESPAAVAESEAIAATDGIDALFVGPTDLARALGRPRDLDDDPIRTAIQRVAGAGKPAGIYAATPAEIAVARAARLQLIAAGSDLAFMLAGARATIAACATTNDR